MPTFNITPQSIASNHGFMGSIFQSSECETILRNLILMQQQFQEFQSFTWDDYKKFCSHNVIDTEKDIIDSFVDGNVRITYNISNYGGGNWLIRHEDGRYSFSEKMILYLKSEWPNN